VARVFVSHAREDLAVASKVYRWLIEAGHEVFLARDLRDGITVGEQWEQRLHDELQRADAVVCLVTSAYLGSVWCAAEIATARARGSRLLPVKAEPGVTHPLLTTVQHTDLTQDPAAARPALVEALRLVDLVWPEDCSPFPGLRSFETDQHRVFFGRTEETKELATLVRSPAEHARGAALLVVGPSGGGKSSLVRAGLVPVIASEPGWWTLPPIVPGADPVAALARELAVAAREAGLNLTVRRVRQRLDNGRLTELADELLLAARDGPRRRLLIVIDQFEELLTQAAPSERARFAELLRPALTGPVQVVATLSPEFLDQMLADPDLATLPTNTYTLRPLRHEALRAVIEKPAGLAGIDVDEGLVDRLVEDTDTGEALPLLAFTLAQLAEGVARGGRLATTRYDQLGGVQGALTHQANAALADAVAVGGRSRKQVVTGLLRLVTVDEHGRPTRCRVNRDELPDPVVAELDTFVARRLLSTDTDNGIVVIGVAHEAFLCAWPPLADAVTASASALRARRAVEHAARDWHDSERPPSRLWSGSQLTTAVTDTGARIGTGTAPTDAAPQRRPPPWWPRRHHTVVTDRVDLSDQARQFLHTSMRRDRSQRRRNTTILSVLLVLALVAVVVAVEQQGAAQEQQRIAVARQLVAQAEAIRDTDPRTALRLGIAAHHIQPGGETRAGLVNTLSTTRYAGALTDPTSSVTFTPDGTTLATGDIDGAVVLRDVTEPAQPRMLGPPLTGHDGSVVAMAFTPDGTTLATASTDGTVILWNLTDPAQPRPLGAPLSGHISPVNSVAFTPNGTILATASTDSTVILWDVTDPAQPRMLGSPLTDHTSSVLVVTFSPDGTILATADANGTITLRDITDPAQPTILDALPTEGTGSVSSVTFTPEGTTLAATADTNGTVTLRDITDPALPNRLGTLPTEGTDSVSSLAFTPDGTTLATADANDTVTLWDMRDPAKPRQLGLPLAGHTGQVNSAAFTSDGATLATASVDKTVILWNTTNPAQPRRINLLPTDHINWAPSTELSQNGTTVTAEIRNDTVILTDTDQPSRSWSPLTGRINTVESTTFDPTGTILATGSRDGTTILWDITNRTQARRLSPLPTADTSPVTSVAFAPDGTALKITSSDDKVTLWNLRGLNDVREHAVARACSIADGGLSPDEWTRYISDLDLSYQDTCAPGATDVEKAQ